MAVYLINIKIVSRLIMVKSFENLSPEVEASAAARAAEIKERGQTRLFVLPFEKREGEKLAGKAEILVGARMQGAINALLPVIKKLQSKGHPISFLVDQPAEAIVRAQFPTAQEQDVDPLAALDSRNPGLILVGNSINGGLGIEFYLTATAEADAKSGDSRIPVVCVEDYPGASIRGQTNYNFFPDVVCAFDEGSEEYDKQRLKDDPNGKGMLALERTKFVVTGSPAFDSMTTENSQAVQYQVRAELGLRQGDLVLTYIGGVPPDDLKNLRILVENLNKIDFGEYRPKFIARIHPAIIHGRLDSYKQAYAELLGSLKSCEVVNTMGLYTTDQIAQTTDVIISDYSTEGIKAAYRGKLPLFMLFPDLGGKGLKAETGMDTLPVIEKKAGIGVFSEADMEQGLRRLLLDKESQARLRDAQRQYYHLDGHNADRVVEVIEQLLKNK